MERTFQEEGMYWNQLGNFLNIHSLGPGLLSLGWDLEFWNSSPEHPGKPSWDTTLKTYSTYESFQDLYEEKS